MKERTQETREKKKRKNEIWAVKKENCVSVTSTRGFFCCRKRDIDGSFVIPSYSQRVWCLTTCAKHCSVTLFFTRFASLSSSWCNKWRALALSFTWTTLSFYVGFASSCASGRKGTVIWHWRWHLKRLPDSCVAFKDWKYGMSCSARIRKSSGATPVINFGLHLDRKTD